MLITGLFLSSLLLAAPCTPPTVDLEEGATGLEVEQLQHCLVQVGLLTRDQEFSGPGQFGGYTRWALELLQRKNNLTQTGRYDERTRRALAQELGALESLVTQMGEQGQWVHSYNNRYLAALWSPRSPRTVEAFAKLLPQVRDSTDPEEAGATVVVDGDMPVFAQDLRAFLSAASKGEHKGGLLLNLKDPETKALDIWPSEQRRELTYSVNRRSFGARYEEVVENVARAAQEWMDACRECDVRFIHRREYDGDDVDPVGGKVLFVVRQHNFRGAYVALAFFPSSRSWERYIELDPSYFTSRFDRVGILRHEFGHVLGYRHEHVIGPQCVYLLKPRNGPLPPEDPNKNPWYQFGHYDSTSVMHYPCTDGRGSTSFALSETDKALHRTFYALTGE